MEFNPTINCLRNCSALCCKKSSYFRIAFDFDSTEAKMMTDAGAILTFSKKDNAYYMENDCPFLKDNFCRLHQLPEQPNCCRVNKAGYGLCLSVRAHTFNPRFINEVE